MTEDELYDLYKLHLLDAAMRDLKHRAASFDPFAEIRPTLRVLKPKWEAAQAEYKRVAGEIKDLELQQKSAEDKIKQIDRTMYGGSVVNSKEADAYAKDLATTKAKLSEIEGKMLELMEVQPGAKKAYDELNVQMIALNEKIETLKAGAVAEKERLQAEYKERARIRPNLVAKVPETMLTQYDAIRSRHDGVGMAVVTEKGTCGACGMVLPDRSVMAAKEQRWITCEDCHRILFHIVPKL